MFVVMRAGATEAEVNGVKGADPRGGPDAVRERRARTGP